VAVDKDDRQQSIYFFGEELGFTTKGGGVVDVVAPGGQAQEKGVRKGWRVVAIDDEAVPPTTFDGDLARRLKTAIVRGGDCVQVTFSLPALKLKAAPPAAATSRPNSGAKVDRSKVQRQKSCLRDLGALNEEDRRKNLRAISCLSSKETTQVLRDKSVVQGLLGQRCSDELSLLCGEKNARQLQETLELHEQLTSGLTPSVDEAKRADLQHKDAEGNTALHMARNAKSFAVLLDLIQSTKSQSALTRSSASEDCVRRSLRVKNWFGETPIQSALRHAADSVPKRAELMKFFLKRVPDVMRDAMAEVISLVPTAERTALMKPKFEWPVVRSCLLSNDVSSLLAGYDELTQKMRLKSRENLVNLQEHSCIWTDLLVEHCFGVLRRSTDALGCGLEHCEASRERLGAVWTALRRLLEACADPKLPTEEAGRLKDVTKGLLVATRGPCSPMMDPREPYRELLLGLVRTLQGRTASHLRAALKAATKADPAAAEELQHLPPDELRGLDTSAAAARGGSARLRMDARLAEDKLREGAGGDAGEALVTPEWVVEQTLEPKLFEELKRWGCAERASDVVDITGGVDSQGRSAAASVTVQEGLTEERLRFCRLHAAWLRGLCSEQQAALARRLRAAVGLDEKSCGEEEGPWEAGGGSKVTFFRTRSEAKGLPRILEKMNEALEEEVLAGESQSLLRTDLAAPMDESEAQDSQIQASLSQREAALNELLTPACYICDVNGAEVVVESFSDMLLLYRHLISMSMQKDQCQVVRVKNGFCRELHAAEVSAKGGYRDLKLWLMVSVSGLRLVAELQVHLRSFHELKRVMHLPYECSRGSFDHPHLAGLWRHGDAQGSRCCCAIA